MVKRLLDVPAELKIAFGREVYAGLENHLSSLPGLAYRAHRPSPKGLCYFMPSLAGLNQASLPGLDQVVTIGTRAMVALVGMKVEANLPCGGVGPIRGVRSCGLKCDWRHAARASNHNFCDYAPIRKP
ncbi:hypothetical protein VN12_03415 [Pirellula sp. SH-Sr6A]|nr:hypothetical protein VN12_03415 [Pirellula sp. SH-Sr6A]